MFGLFVRCLNFEQGSLVLVSDYLVLIISLGHWYLLFDQLLGYVKRDRLNSTIIADIPPSPIIFSDSAHCLSSTTKDFSDRTALVTRHGQFMTREIMIAILLVGAQVEEVIIRVVVQADETMNQKEGEPLYMLMPLNLLKQKHMMSVQESSPFRCDNVY